MTKGIIKFVHTPSQHVPLRWEGEYYMTNNGIGFEHKGKRFFVPYSNIVSIMDVD